ncbi:MAG TPA: hypothetical protein VJ672_00055 [Gemmatimonadaceae bacterium]|nr:hypothetical protein [Gemmatimonadaceae bacterium]
MIRHRSGTALGIAALLVPLCASLANAQARPRPRGQTIEIRGQVPTPQVVTVRPREVPQFTRSVLVPLFYDRTFWPTILPAYALVPMRDLTGTAPVDTTPQPVVAVGVPSVSLPPTPVATTPTPSGPPAMSAADSAAAAAAAAARQAELDAIRAELDRRRARLDSLSSAVREMGRGRQRGGQPAPSDTTRPTPSSPDGGSPR